MGTVTSLQYLTDKDIKSFWSKIDVKDIDECWLWQGELQKDGYGVFSRNRKNEPRIVVRAHRLSFILTNGYPPEDKPMILHGCDVRPCCNPNHLRAGTAEDNASDVVVRNRHWTTTQPDKIARGDNHWSRLYPDKVSSGSRHGGAKLNEELVALIKKEYAEKTLSQRGLAKKYNVSQATIWQIVNNNYWKVVT